MVHIERDINKGALELEVANKLQQIFSTLEPEGPKEVSKNGVSFVSIEDAMKELLDMGVNT